MKRAQQETGQRVLFTGPDGIGDYRPRLDYFPRSNWNRCFISRCHEGSRIPFPVCPTGDPAITETPLHRGGGLGLQYSSQLNRAVIHSKQNEFDKYHSVADGVAHSQWHTSPQFRDKQLPCTNRGTLDRQSEDNNAVPAKQGDILYKQEQEGQSLYTEKVQIDSVTFPQI